MRTRNAECLAQNLTILLLIGETRSRGSLTCSHGPALRYGRTQQFNHEDFVLLLLRFENISKDNARGTLWCSLGYEEIYIEDYCCQNC